MKHQTAKNKRSRPLVYSYLMTIGPDDKPKVREFGNIQSSRKGKGFNLTGHLWISAEREPLADLTVSANEVKVTVELPCVNKENIRIDAYDGAAVEVTTNDIQRKYHRIMELPPETDFERSKSK